MAYKEKPICKYGSKCYRKNPEHFRQYDHPNAIDLADTSSPSRPTVIEIPDDDDEPPLAKKQRIEEDSDLYCEPNITNEPSGDSQTSQEANAPLFYFTKVRGIPSSFNGSSMAVGIKDLLSSSMGELVSSVQFNYLFDIPWLLQQYPEDKRKTSILVVYGDQRDTTLQLRKDARAYSNVKLFPAKLEIMFGTHHSKMMFLQYKNGIRVVIHTANLIAKDWDQKTQGVWISPLFPAIPPSQTSTQSSEASVQSQPATTHSTTNFKQDLLEYLQAYGGTALDEWKQRIKDHDMTSSRVRLVASVPGAHSGPNMHRWGHLKLKKVLSEYSSDISSVNEHWPVVGQFSSVGSLGPTSDSWLCSEWLHSLSSSLPKSGKYAIMHKNPSLKLIFPTVDNVRRSLEGYMAGGSIPYSFQTAQKQPYLNNYLCQWKATNTGRTHAAPHIKTYTRLSPDCSKALWFLVTSANLSKAAWGCLEKKGTQLKIRSYEIGVLFLPSDIKTSCKMFNLTSESEIDPAEVRFRGVPFDVPLTRYSKDDKPWIWNIRHDRQPDRHGNVWTPPK